MSGWFKLHRELYEKPIWTNSTPEQKTVLMTLMSMVGYEENEWEWKGEKYKTKPGQMVTSLPSIASKCGKGISIQNVRSSLKRFEKLEFLTDESTNKNRLITIVNWGIYQGSEDKATDNPTGNQQATNRQPTAIKKERTKEPNKLKKSDKEIKTEFGEFVRLTQKEYDKLVEDFSKCIIDSKIEDMNLYIESKGTKYKSHNAALRQWLKRDKVLPSSNQASGVDPSLAEFME